MSAEFQQCMGTPRYHPVPDLLGVIAPTRQLIALGLLRRLPVQLISGCPGETGLASCACSAQFALLARQAHPASPDQPTWSFFGDYPNWPASPARPVQPTSPSGTACTLPVCLFWPASPASSSQPACSRLL